ncbi:hypothetical protein GCM10009582_09850 [Arthrobacter flavus]
MSVKAIGVLRSFRARPVCLALILATGFGLAACSLAEEPSDALIEGPQRPVLGICEVTGTAQECAERLTEIYLEADDAYENLAAPTDQQTQAIQRMVAAAELYSTKCRSLNVRAGAEVNISNGCDSAIGDIVQALSAVQ